ncbi:hypothetical protein DMB66_46670 [Actinoplanes sp. ATCC 53533]|uniref:hypothetical protein n=1 Tax=Actinoplanes sp. ATCC 53533 TaxID=1288362 RepID=UPI000F783DE7|nr:hypothetical protein [Actinoplanes sp. ATCC 53533]RSM48352.1 hypothetical protein DMB66_46670 [Actinoplanes sp. ATCC 53533]
MPADRFLLPVDRFLLSAFCYLLPAELTTRSILGGALRPIRVVSDEHGVFDVLDDRGYQAGDPVPHRIWAPAPSCAARDRGLTAGSVVSAAPDGTWARWARSAVSEAQRVESAAGRRPRRIGKGLARSGAGS